MELIFNRLFLLKRLRPSVGKIITSPVSFQVFKSVLASIQEQNGEWYLKMMAPLKKNDLVSISIQLFFPFLAIGGENKARIREH